MLAGRLEINPLVLCGVKMKKAILAFGLALTTIVSVSAQEAAVEAVSDAVVAAPAAVEEAAVAAPATEAAVVAAPVEEGTVLDGQIVDGADMTYTAAPAMAAPVAQSDCGCGAPAVEAAPSVVEAAPAADCGCGAPVVEAAPELAPAVADCGCEAAPVETCGCEAAPTCEEPAPTCCRQPRQRRYVVRSAVSSLRARRSCCCN